MSSYFQVFAQVHPAQSNRISVHTHIYKTEAPALPAPSIVSFGNFHTLRRYFPTPEQAQTWACYLKSVFTKGSVNNPIMDGGQIQLFADQSEERTK
jgi:hypothetical protein